MPDVAASPASAGRGRLVTAILKRELRQYVHTPGTYVALAFFFILSGAIFTMALAEYAADSAIVLGGQPLGDGVSPLDPTERLVSEVFSALDFLVLFLIPILTMRLISEEKKSGTFELLVSTPLGNWQILLGKFLAALAVGVVVLLVCAAYPLVALTFCAPQVPVILSCYFGLFLIIMAYTAFGLFASSVSESQIAAAVLSFAGLLMFHMIGWLFKAGILGRIATALSIHKHSENFTKGIISSTDVAYFVLFAAFFLFLAAQVLDARKWRA